MLSIVLFLRPADTMFRVLALGSLISRWSCRRLYSVHTHYPVSWLSPRAIHTVAIFFLWSACKVLSLGEGRRKDTLARLSVWKGSCSFLALVLSRSELVPFDNRVLRSGLICLWPFYLCFSSSVRVSAHAQTLCIRHNQLLVFPWNTWVGFPTARFLIVQRLPIDTCVYIFTLILSRMTRSLVETVAMSPVHCS